MNIYFHEKNEGRSGELGGNFECLLELMTGLKERALFRPWL
jgi:hypothetical protein